MSAPGDVVVSRWLARLAQAVRRIKREAKFHGSLHPWCRNKDELGSVSLHFAWLPVRVHYTGSDGFLREGRRVWLQLVRRVNTYYNGTTFFEVAESDFGSESELYRKVKGRP